MNCKFLTCLIFSYITFSSSLSAEKIQPTAKFHPLQTILQRVDDCQWRLAYDADVGSMVTQCFVHTSDDIEKAPEMFTLHYLPAAENISCEEYNHNFMSAIKLASGNFSIHSNIIQASQDSLFWHWNTDTTGPEEENELVFVKKYGKAFIVYRYTTTIKNLDSTHLKKWQDFMANALQNSRFLYETSNYRLWLPNMWQITELSSLSLKSKKEFFSPCDYSINVCLKMQPQSVVENDLSTIRRLFKAHEKESEEIIQLNNQKKTILYTFNEPSAGTKELYKKLVAKVENNNKTAYLYATICCSDNFSENKAEYISVLQSVELF